MPHNRQNEIVQQVGKYMFVGVPHNQNEHSDLTTSKRSGASVQVSQTKQAYYIITPPTVVGIPNLQEFENLRNLHRLVYLWETCNR